ncbi:hypothetical protein DES49_0541 [Halospina denitrificans]|uniref:Uncharacterized protein n=1 Tax=Halospina denitrificans TaxID=332522 RepID=A0A4V3ERC4_9GAMM|nr:hypothetical protein [Halospina denitrificans]TDT44438.1 hypothetical protein DES49_0541 [Halospina denitrificans]
MKGNKPENPPEQEMPEYEMFPEGMWHMLGAVMLMVFSAGGIVILFSRIVAPLVEIETLAILSFGGAVVMALILSTPTFLLSRGWARCHTFLLWLNALYLFAFMVGVGFFFLQGKYGLVSIGLVGILFVGLARYLYNSRSYRAGVEHYRLIWAHYRAGTNRKG